jgi:hypothetical protein
MLDLQPPRQQIHQLHVEPGSAPLAESRFGIG